MHVDALKISTPLLLYYFVPIRLLGVPAEVMPPPLEQRPLYPSCCQALLAIYIMMWRLRLPSDHDMRLGILEMELSLPLKLLVLQLGVGV
jgi:hypothetical protein